MVQGLLDGRGCERCEATGTLTPPNRPGSLAEARREDRSPIGRRRLANLITTPGRTTFTWIGLAIAGAVLGLRLSWSLIRARVTGQIEAD
jgi:hypothetical protein